MIEQDILKLPRFFPAHPELVEGPARPVPPGFDFEPAHLSGHLSGDLFTFAARRYPAANSCGGQLEPAHPEPVEGASAAGSSAQSSPSSLGEGDHPQDGGGVLALVLAERFRQAEKFGHTTAADDARDLYEFSKGAGRLLHRMNETASLHNVEQTKNGAIKLTAYCLAFAESCHRRTAALSALDGGVA